jgi:putative (di)nucleoside polyphosphate hydrolase
VCGEGFANRADEKGEAVIDKVEGPGEGKFRRNVGLMIVNRERRILAGEAFHYAGEWMMPQGGIDAGESPLEAMQRELQEETGLLFSQVRLLREHDDWLRYLFRKPQYKDDVFYIGQSQRWFLLEYNGPLPDAATVEEREFLHFDWVDADWLVEQIPAFEKEVYKSVVAAFRPFLP